MFQDFVQYCTITADHEVRYNCTKGYDGVIRKATNSLFRRAELCLQKNGGHFEQ